LAEFNKPTAAEFVLFFSFFPFYFGVFNNKKKETSRVIVLPTSWCILFSQEREVQGKRGHKTSNTHRSDQNNTNTYVRQQIYT
jgi:hypothetical protein